MYDLVKKDKVLSELNSGSDLYVVDIPTLRVIACNEMTLQAVKSFIDKSEALFLKRVAND